MATHITPEGVEKVAHLARIQLSENDRAQAVTELETILTYMDRLAEVDTSGVAPYALPSVTTAELRQDPAKPFVDQGSLMDPRRFKQGLLVTKGVFSETGDDNGS